MSVVLGMDFGGTKIALAVCDLDGRCRGQQVLATGAEDGGPAVLRRGMSAARALVGQTGPAGRLVAVGLSTIGIPGDDGVELAPAIPGWDQVPLVRAVRDAFGVPVGAATDVKAAATAEVRWGALAGATPAIYLNLGTGLAVAIVVDGQVVQGAHGASGEIGYNLVAAADVGLALGQRPVLEDTVSGMGIAARAAALLGRPVTAEDVFLGAPRDPGLETLATALIGALSAHLVNLTIAVDPARIAVGGGMVRSWARLQGPLEAALKAGVPFPPELVLASRPFDAALVGALALGAEAAGAHLARAACLSAT